MGYALKSTMFAAALFVSFCSTQTARAQYRPYGGPSGVPNNNGPAYSPYLNLLNRGNSPGANYYGLVRPEMEFRNAYRGLQQQLDMQQQYSQQQPDQGGLPTTGHVATFLNYRSYFLQTNAMMGPRPFAGQGQQNARPIQQSTSPATPPRR